MENVSIIGLDLAKSVFQLHGARADGSVAFRIKLTRAKLLPFFASAPRCVVAMEACAGAHHWGREISAMGHDVRLIAPIHVKPFVGRNKNDAIDAQAIAEAASRPTMRFVPLKSTQTQASAMIFKARDLLVRQRTQTINALRGHMAEFGVVAPNGPVHVARLAHALEDPTAALPAAVISLCRMLLSQIAAFGSEIARLDKELLARARQDDTARRLMTIPGIGVICATAMEALAPPPETFRKGRDFAAWLGLTPRQHSSGGKTRLGPTTKMGQRDLRRLLICGAVALVRWAARKGATSGSWLTSMLERKPRMVVAVAMANRMARIVWALMAKGGVYKVPAAANA
jgi:transposase